jgi:DNA-3-methyladenine glycosylase
MQYKDFQAKNFDKIDREFFLRNTEQVAQDLLGIIFVKKESDGLLAGRIVETEAYLHEKDEASHSYRGPTKRNAAMFGEGGIVYVYKIYGMYHCLNFVTEGLGIGAAVLIRAMEPLEGIKTMKTRRGTDSIAHLLSGPGKICQAFKFDLSWNNRKLFSDPDVSLFIDKAQIGNVLSTERIGISRSKELKLRFIIENSPFLSRKKIPKNQKK